MINDFSIKACKSKLEELGYENIEYFSSGSVKDRSLVFYFKYEFRGVCFYFSYFDSFHVPVDAFSVLKNYFDYYVRYYGAHDFSAQEIKNFMRDQAMKKVCFDDKISYSFPSAAYDKFVDKCYKKYDSCKEFMEDLDNLNLRSELEPMNDEYKEVV